MGKCSYNYVSNAVAIYAEPEQDDVNRMVSNLKHAADPPVKGIYKDDDSKYSLDCILKIRTECQAMNDIIEMVYGLGLMTAAIRLKELMMSPEIGGFSPQQLLREVITLQYLKLWKTYFLALHIKICQDFLLIQRVDQTLIFVRIMGIILFFYYSAI